MGQLFVHGLIFGPMLLLTGAAGEVGESRIGESREQSDQLVCADRETREALVQMGLDPDTITFTELKTMLSTRPITKQVLEYIFRETMGGFWDHEGFRRFRDAFDSHEFDVVFITSVNARVLYFQYSGQVFTYQCVSGRPVELILEHLSGWEPSLSSSVDLTDFAARANLSITQQDLLKIVQPNIQDILLDVVNTSPSESVLARLREGYDQIEEGIAYLGGTYATQTESCYIDTFGSVEGFRRLLQIAQEQRIFPAHEMTIAQGMCSSILDALHMSIIHAQGLNGVRLFEPLRDYMLQLGIKRGRESYLRPDILPDVRQMTQQELYDYMLGTQACLFPRMRGPFLIALPDSTYVYFPPSCYVEKGLLTPNLIHRMQSGEIRRTLSMGAGPAHIEQMLVYLGVDPERITLADISDQFTPIGLPFHQFDMNRLWPSDLGEFDLIMFLESAGFRDKTPFLEYFNEQEWLEVDPSLGALIKARRNNINGIDHLLSEALDHLSSIGEIRMTMSSCGLSSELIDLVLQRIQQDHSVRVDYRRESNLLILSRDTD
ncbi:MAG: hypothetical protein COS89_05320 [Deltaproteobacteria bacterium CG07_land_8_20_14_0_80_38_7]|nr:MAG: hypothetical protein COS89_05320 [Deltaproteobacteria bacterium CG07_land_8_20_14_0_80_38_7]